MCNYDADIDHHIYIILYPINHYVYSDERDSQDDDQKHTIHKSKHIHIYIYIYTRK